MVKCARYDNRNRIFWGTKKRYTVRRWFFKQKESDSVPKLVISNRKTNNLTNKQKIKGQTKLETESYKRFVKKKEIFRKKFYVWWCYSKTGFTSCWVLSQQTQPRQRLGEGSIYYLQQEGEYRGIVPKHCLRIFISNKFLDDANAGSPGTTLWETLI